MEFLFSKSISPEENVIGRLRFELAYYNVVVQHVSHYVMGTPPRLYMCNCAQKTAEKKRHKHVDINVQ